MNDALLPFFTHRTELSEQEADALLRALAEDPALRRWLREQLAMEDLLSRSLQPERADFTNRLHAMRDKSGDSERFVARVRGLAGATNAEPAVLAQPAPSPRGAAVRPASARMRAPTSQRRFLGAWSVAAAAALVVAATALWAWSARRPQANEVLQGSIVVNDRPVANVPDGAGFTVAGDQSAVIRLASGSKAQFAPASAATIRADQPASAPVVQLASGGGEFQVDRGQAVRIETSVGTVTGNGEDAQFTAELTPTVHHDGRPGSADAGNIARKGPEELAVAVRSGSAKVEFRGKKHIIVANEARVFSLVEDKVTEQNVVRGLLKSITATGPGASIAVGEKDGLHTISIGPLTRVRLNDAESTAAELHPGDHLEVHVAKDGPMLAVQISAKRGIKKIEEEPHHPKPGEH